MLELVGEPELDPDFVRKVKRYKSDAIVLFTPHLALNEAPRYAVENPDVGQIVLERAYDNRALAALEAQGYFAGP